MIISLVGISGSGKSYWSKKLESKGFKRYCCDDLIEEKLSKELKTLGYSGIQDVAKWMGQPFDQQYKRTSRKYLILEKEVMHEIFEEIKMFDKNQNIVIDTTGSLIYTGKKILSTLIELTKPIYLHTPSLVKQQMFELYIKDPKPIIWGNKFVKNKSENNIEALKRCYPNLLVYRVDRYKKLADIILDYFLLRSKLFDEHIFSEIIKKYD